MIFKKLKLNYINKKIINLYIKIKYNYKCFLWEIKLSAENGVELKKYSFSLRDRKQNFIEISQNLEGKTILHCVYLLSQIFL